MSNQLIDFESGSTTTGDSGERTTSTAIKPVLSGEGVKSAVLDRPLENLRARTEEIRKSVEDLLYRADADKWIITGGSGTGAVTVPGAAAFPTVTWNATAGATGTFTISEPIVIQPLMAPYRDIKGIGKGTHQYTITDSVPNTVIFSFYSRLFDYQLANQLRIIWEEADHAAISGGYCVATLEGSPAHILRIVIRDDGMTQGTNIDTALGLILPATAVSHSMGGTGSTYGSTYVALSDITDPDFVIKGNYSRELHRLTNTELVTFFGTTANHMHTDGEGLGIWFEEIIDSDPLTFGGRRQSTPDTAPAPNTAVTASKLFLTTIESSKIHGAIPLCRRIGTYLVFVDGTVVGNGQTVKFGQKGTEIVDIFALLADQAGADAGNTLIGCDAVTDTPLSLVAGTQRAQTVELLGDVNDLALEIDDLREDRVYSYNLDAADPQKMISTGLWGNHTWGTTMDSINVLEGAGASAKCYVDLAVYFNANGDSRLLVLDATNFKVEVWDPRDYNAIAPEAISGSLRANLPTGSSQTWVPYSMCTDGTSVYIMFGDTNLDPNDTHIIQAWDIATWGVKAGWPTTGTALPGSGKSLLKTQFPDGRVIVANDTYLATMNCWTVVTAISSAVITLIRISNGTTSAAKSGAGDCPPGSAIQACGRHCSDGINIYFSTYVSAVNSMVCSAVISNVQSGIGAWSGALSLGFTFHGRNLISCGQLMVVSALTDDGPSNIATTMVRTHTRFTRGLDTVCLGQDSYSSPHGGDKVMFKGTFSGCFDGINLWLLGYVDNSTTDIGNFTLAKIDVAKLSAVQTNVSKQLCDVVSGIFYIAPNTLFAGGNDYESSTCVFDGRDIWCIVEPRDGHTNSGKIFRLPLALLRH